MASQISLTESYPTRIAGLKSVQKLGDLERQWAAALRKSADDPRDALAALLSCETGYQALQSTTHSLQFLQSSRSCELDKLISQYRDEIADIYRHIRTWLVIYFDISVGSDKDDIRMTGKAKQFSRSALKDEADTYWLSFASGEQPAFEGDAVQHMLRLKKARDVSAKNSPEARRLNRQLVSFVFDQLLDALNKACLRMDKLFERVIFRESAQRLLAQDDSSPAAESKTDPFRQHMFVRRVEDWIRGYHPPSSREKALDRQVFEKHCRGLQTKHYRRLFQQALKITAVATAVCGLVVFLKTSEVDNRMYNVTAVRIKKLLGLDPASVRLKQRRKFFSNQILAIKDNYSEEGILKNLQAFEQLEQPNQQEKALYFAENVLKGYFLLMTDWNTSNSFKKKVLKVVRNYDEDIHHHLMSLTEMFSEKTMQEVHFQFHALLLRKALVNKGVFPFMFMSLYKDHPYVFVYPERIIDEYYFDNDQLQNIGLNVSYYSHAANIPLTAHVVEGKNYPFKERAGYFEGQYAIVFNDVAGNPRWTAWHEFGHSVDQLRFTFGKVIYHRNVEVHAMLFPVIFTRNPATYIQNKLIPNVQAADPKDLYVQAAKGILNGFVLHQKERNPNLSLNLITDTFNPQTIEDIRQWIGRYNSEQLRLIALDLYQETGTYLHTAKGGTYRGHFGASEEIVAGAHGPPAKSYTVDDIGDGDFSSESSTRFLRDKQQDAAKPKNLWAFIKAVIHITLHPKATTTNRHSMEAIASSILIFILVELLLVLIQWLGAPLRKRKYNGVRPNRIINEIYDGHPWSDGHSVGKQKGERRLLQESFKADPATLDKQWSEDIAAFKASTDKKRKVLFDVCLTLAPWIPKRSAVKARWHNLLFWLPFLGPVLGRWSWMMPRQRLFHQREDFNTDIKNLCTSVRDATSLNEFLDRYKEIIFSYQSTTIRKSVEYRDDIEYLDALEKQVHECINASGARVTLRKPMVTHRAIQNYHEAVDFDRLDKYVFGDDIKRIDWRATARAVNNEPVVRKSAGVYGLNVGFILDFRDVHEYSGREQFALDFEKSLRMLGKDRFLKQLIFIMPNGEIFNQRIHIKLPVSPHARALLLWDTVKRHFEENLRYRQQLNILGLKFYSDEENEHYCERYKLTEFPKKSTGGIVFEKLDINNLNVFLIGMSAKKRNEVPNYLSATNQVFFW